VFAALGIQHATRMLDMGVAYPALQYFFTLSHKWHKFQGIKMSVFIFSTNLVRNIYHSKKK